MSFEKAKAVLEIIRKQREDNKVKLLSQCGQFYISFRCFSSSANISLLFLIGQTLIWDLAAFCREVTASPCWQRSKISARAWLSGKEQSPGWRGGPHRLQAESIPTESPLRSVRGFQLVLVSGLKFPFLLWRVSFSAGAFWILLCISRLFIYV